MIDVALTDGQRDIMLLSSEGRAMRFAETEVRTIGRTAAGVRGIRMDESKSVIALIVVKEGDVLTATENGYGKRTSVEEYPRKGRGGLGVIDIKTSERNGDVIGATLVRDDDQMMLISNSGTLVRISIDEVSSLGRNTQGVRLIRLGDEEKLVELERIDAADADVEGDEGEEAEGGDPVDGADSTPDATDTGADAETPPDE